MPLENLHALLMELQAVLAQSAQRAAAVHREDAARHDAVEREFAPLRQLAFREAGAEPPVDHVDGCAEPGWVFLSTAPVFEDVGDDMQFEIAGARGSATFVFTSGMAQADIIKAINAFTGRTGAVAHQAPACNDTVAIRSELPGADQFVGIAQMPRDTVLRISLDPCAAARFEDYAPIMLVDWGRGVTGDVDCDDDVGLSDLLAMLHAWGACSRCPEDLDGDGVVGVDDLLALLRNWT